MKIYGVFGILLFILFLGVVYSASSTPTIQISSYAPVPITIYPGTNGQLQLTLSNAGGISADAITIYYDNGPGPVSNQQISIGGIGAGSTTIASIPFAVPSQITNGILLIHLDIYYSYDSGGTKTGNTRVTIPLSVSQHDALAVKTISVNGTGITPGDKFTATLEITNLGGIAKNLVIRHQNGSSFTLDGTTQQTIGDVEFNKSRNVNVVIRSSSSATAGKYMVPLIAEYEDAVQNKVSQTIYIGPVSVADSSSQFIVDLKPVTSTEVGSEVLFELTVENRGSTSSSVIIDLAQSSTFTSLGNNRIYFDYLKAGEKQVKNITIGIGSSVTGGYYLLPISILVDGKNYTQNLGVEVKASQELTILSSTEPSLVSPGSSGVKVLAQIANTGNTPIRSVYVTTLPTKNVAYVGATDKFIGTLNVDDFTTFQFTVNIPARLFDNTTSSNYSIPIRISFKDSTNTQHTVDKSIILHTYSQAEVSQYGASSSVPSGGAGFRKTDNSFWGLGLFGFVGVVIVLVIAAYFGYKKFGGKAK